MSSINRHDYLRQSHRMRELHREPLRFHPHPARDLNAEEQSEKGIRADVPLPHHIHADYRGTGDDDVAVAMTSVKSHSFLVLIGQIHKWMRNPNHFVEDEEEESLMYSVRVSAKDLLMVGSA